VVCRTLFFKKDHLHACPGASCVRPMMGTYGVSRPRGLAQYRSRSENRVRGWSGSGCGAGWAPYKSHSQFVCAWSQDSPETGHYGASSEPGVLFDGLGRLEALVSRSLWGSIAWTWADTGHQTSAREACSQQSSGIWGGRGHIAALHGSGVPFCGQGRVRGSRIGKSLGQHCVDMGGHRPPNFC
jgi:hypothetical protein